MGVIREELTLVDGFSASFRTFNQLGQQATQNMFMLDKSITRAMGKSAGATIGAIRQLTDQAAETNRILSEMAQKQEKITDETRETASASGNWLSSLKRIAAAVGAVSLAKSFLSTADTMSQIDAGIKAINYGMQSTEELQQMIYESAQRARASYTDTAGMIIRIGQNARGAFDSNAELIQFAENLNKSFVIGRASQEEMSSATLQLSQAMAAGVLRGEELNAVFDSAPSIIEDIAEYLGVGTDEIRSLAEQGKLTADVVKDALLQATDDINEQFKEMPMTLGQAFTKGKNYIQQSLKESFEDWTKFINSENGQKLISGITVAFAALANAAAGAADIAIWAGNAIVDNWDILLPVLIGIVAAVAVFGAVCLASGLAAAAGWIAAAWPFLLIAGIVIALIYVLHGAGVSFQQMGEAVGTVFGFIYALIYNIVADIWNLIAVFIEFFANVWNDPVGSIVRLFAGLLDTILGIVETVADAIDALLGTDMAGAVSGFRNDFSKAVEDKFGSPEITVNRMEKIDTKDSMINGAVAGGNIGAKLDNMDFNLEDITSGLDDAGSLFSGNGDIENVGTVGTVKNVQGDVSLSDEDVQLYRDLAERRYMNSVELQTLAPNITVSIPESAAGSLKAQDVADEINAILIEQMASHTAVSHG